MLYPTNIIKLNQPEIVGVLFVYATDNVAAAEAVVDEVDLVLTLPAHPNQQV